MMKTLLHTLVWLLTALVLTTQELVKLSVNPKINAECGKQVTLNCDVSSSQNGLAIKHMKWSQNNTSFCSVDSEEKLTHYKHKIKDFHCEYRHGQLSLIFKSLQPLESGVSKRFMCKLQSNQGTSHAYTRVELQECCGIAEGVVTNHQPTCTFKKVHPDGDVEWFHGSHNLSDGSVRSHTTKHVDQDGWLTIHSSLERKISQVPYSCSLRSTVSGRYIASTLVQNPESLVLVRNGDGSQGPGWTFFWISILLAATLT